MSPGIVERPPLPFRPAAGQFTRKRRALMLEQPKKEARTHARATEANLVIPRRMLPVPLRHLLT